MDITILYITASLIPERFANFQRRTLLRAIGSRPIISVSRKPLDFGHNILDEEERSISNIYRQMLRAAKLAKTSYVAMAEDDALYHRRHFQRFRPPEDTFAYDSNRLILFTWGEPFYSYKDRISNATLVAPTKLLITALEERFDKYPQGTPLEYTGELGRPLVETNLGLTHHKLTYFAPDISVVVFNHDFASERWQREHKKRPGTPRAYDIPHWGHAERLVKRFK